MRNISDAAVVLKLNKRWEEIGVSSVGKALIDLVAGVIHAVDIDYPRDEQGNPLENSAPNYIKVLPWEEWMKLPVRPSDLSIRSVRQEFRVPTVVITKDYDKMPKRKPKKNPSTSGVQMRDGNRCQYTGRLLGPDEGSVDHVVPRSRGGTDTWDNVVWADRRLNAEKGNRLNTEAKLRLIHPVRPAREIEAWELIYKPMHRDWVHFMRKMRK